MEEHNKTVIIGWGLAGACLAWQFHRNKVPFEIWDSGENHSTRTAAGLVNPVVFKRLTLSWNVDTVLPYALDFYSQLELELGVRLLSHKPILYPFTNQEDENNWSSRMGDDRFAPYIRHYENEAPAHVKMPHGAGLVKTFGNLDTNLFLDQTTLFMKSAGYKFNVGRFDHTRVLKEPTTNFVFCEGIAVMQNPFFSYLPMKTSHGETLIIESKDLKLEEVVSKNLFLLPLGNGRFKVGATYNWELTEPVLTEAGKVDLVERLEELIDCPYTILEHRAGIRPTVADRRPLLGVHPKQANAFIFNGLGTKGIMLAPYYAERFYRFYTGAETLHTEVNIQRFMKRYRKS